MGYNDDLGFEEKSSQLLLDNALHMHDQFLRFWVRNKRFKDGYKNTTFFYNNQIASKKITRLKHANIF